jgi:DNA-binding CsgD family transcriptional regulator
LSAKTVDTYRGRICEKLGLRTRADLFHYAMAAGMLEKGGGGGL